MYYIIILKHFIFFNNCNLNRRFKFIISGISGILLVLWYDLLRNVQIYLMIEYINLWMCVCFSQWNQYQLSVLGLGKTRLTDSGQIDSVFYVQVEGALPTEGVGLMLLVSNSATESLIECYISTYKHGKVLNQNQKSFHNAMICINKWPRTETKLQLCQQIQVINSKTIKDILIVIGDLIPKKIT